MKDKIEQFFHRAKTLNLSKDEKGVIRVRLLSEMQNLRQQENSQNFLAWRIFLSRHSMSVAFVAILFFTGATTTFAEKSFPGSVFYPVKINVNEKVLGLFARTSQGYAELQIKLAERRLDEVLYLEVESASREIRQVARIRLEEQTKNAEMGVESFVTDNDAEAEVSLATEEAREKTREMASAPALMSTAKGEMPQSFASESPFDKDELIERLKISREKIRFLRKIIYQKSDLSPRDKLQLKKEIFLTEKAIFEIREKLNSGKGDFNGTGVRDVEERINKIETSAKEENESLLKPERIENNRKLPNVDDSTESSIKGESSLLNTTIIESGSGKEIEGAEKGGKREGEI